MDVQLRNDAVPLDVPVRPADSGSRRLELIDFGRFVAALLVITIHVGLFRDVSPILGAMTGGGIARLAVPFFALVSGYFVMAKAVDKGLGSLAGWVKMTSLAYFVVAPFYVTEWVPHLLEAYRHGGVVSAAVQFLKTMLFEGYAPHTWFVPQLVYGMLFGAFIIRLCRGSRLLPAIICVVLYCVALLFTRYLWVTTAFIHNRLLSNDWIMLNLGRNGVTYLFPFIYIGFCVRRYGSRIKPSPRYLTLLVALVVLLAAEAAFNRNRAGHADGLLLVPIVALVGFPQLVEIASRGYKFGKGYSFRTASSIIYYMHPLPLIPLSFILPQAGNTLRFGVAALAAIVISTLGRYQAVRRIFG